VLKDVELVLILIFYQDTLYNILLGVVAGLKIERMGKVSCLC
jgi:hypothetical protein